MEYVRGSEFDKWHWCKNCTQYPMFIYQKIAVKPPSDFCEQCETRTRNENCQCEKLETKTPDQGLKRELSTFSYNIA